MPAAHPTPRPRFPSLPARTSQAACPYCEAIFGSSLGLGYHLEKSHGYARRAAELITVRAQVQRLADRVLSPELPDGNAAADGFDAILTDLGRMLERER